MVCSRLSMAGVCMFFFRFSFVFFFCSVMMFDTSTWLPWFCLSLCVLVLVSANDYGIFFVVVFFCILKNSLRYRLENWTEFIIWNVSEKFCFPLFWLIIKYFHHLFFCLIINNNNNNKLIKNFIIIAHHKNFIDKEFDKQEYSQEMVFPPSSYTKIFFSNEKL